MENYAYKILTSILSIGWFIFFFIIDLSMLSGNALGLYISPFFLMLVSTLWLILIYYLFNEKLIKYPLNYENYSYEKNYTLTLSFLFLIFALLSIILGFFSDFYIRTIYGSTGHLGGYYMGEKLLAYAFTLFTFFVISSMVFYIKYKKINNY